MVKFAMEPDAIRGVSMASDHKRGRGVRRARQMIEQRPMDKPTRSAALDEARLRQQAIGVKLRQIFDDVVNEPVPDEFLDILRKADERGGKD
jgi:hypothetical protein